MGFDINGSFRFHPVGQGLFYSGVLTGDGMRTLFRFVYDCGTEKDQSVLNAEIAQFANNRGATKPRLDWLVISHFHDDHISGLPTLFDSFQVDTVSVPYMSQSYLELAKLEHECRKAAAGGGSGDASAGGGSGDASDGAGSGDAIAEFFDNPSGWLAARGVKTVVFSGVGSGAGGGGLPPSDDPPPKDPPPDDPSPVILVEDEGEGGVQFRIPSENVRSVRNAFHTIRGKSVSIREVHLKDGASGAYQLRLNHGERKRSVPLKGLKTISVKSSTSTVWEFFLDNLNPESDDKLKAYLEQVNGYLKTHSLRDFLLDKCDKDNKPMKEVLEPVKDTLNRTSVVMLHRPALDLHCKRRPPGLFLGKTYGTLLTGDVTLKKSKDAAQLTSILGSAQNCMVLQYPHHGGYGTKYHHERFRNLNAGVVVFSYGEPNKYGHPGEEAVTNCGGAVIQRVTQDKASGFEYALDVSYKEP